ncbi:MAG: GNAT family N-acetyltransferase [Ruminococcus sp.]|nr:GNAT family N-acetyltransferase [Ruminococcus sp.]
MSIKTAKTADFDTVKEITVKTIAAIYPHYYPKGAVEFFLEHHNDENITYDIHSNKVFLCFDNEHNPVGTATIKDNEICRLFVLPKYQGNGYGRELLEFCEKAIFEKYDEILPDAPLPAKRIYLKRGYTSTETNLIKVNYDDFLYYDVMSKKKA